MAANVQWYQTESCVTITLKLDGISEKSITGDFTDRKSTILVEGTPVWSCELSYPIRPKLCKVVRAGKRVEVKLRKGSAEKWAELQGTNLIQYHLLNGDSGMNHSGHLADAGQDGSRNTKTSFHSESSLSSAISKDKGPSSMETDLRDMEDYKDEDDSFYTPPEASPPPGQPFHLGTLPNKFDELVSRMEDVVLLNHLPHSMTEMDNGRELFVTIPVPQTDAKKVIVTFNKRSLEIQFTTSDNSFLSSHLDATVNTAFQWKTSLFDHIDPEKCSYQVRERSIEVKLVKASVHRKWKQLHPMTEPTNEENHGNKPHQPQSSAIAETNTFNPSNEINGSSSSMEIDTDDSMVNGFNNLNFTGTEPMSADDSACIITNEFNPFKLAAKPAVMATLPIFDDSDSSDQSGDNAQESLNCTRQSHDLHETEQTTPNAAKSNCSDEASLYKTNSQPSLTSEKLPNKETVQDSPDAVQTFYRLSPNPFTRPSQTCIVNLGNTCFMSSVLQSLSNTVEVRDFFLGEEYKKDVNVSNPLGCKGKMAECFSEVVNSLWYGGRQYFYPRKLKQLVGNKSDRFIGHSQQDAHEFVTFLLDALHEDLNRVKNKPLTQTIESNDRPDAEVANESWMTYKKRNNSFFVDLFGGQFKSTLVCPACSKVSVTFDPFMSLSVPLPKNSRSLSVLFVSKDPSDEPEQIDLSLPPEGTLELLKASVARRTRIPMINLRVFETYRGKIQNLMSDNKQPLSRIGDNDTIIVSEVLSTKEANEEVKEISVIIRFQHAPCPTFCSRRECGKPGSDLKRCTRCRTVAYCNRECQGKDWSEHKLKCKPNVSVPVAVPFVISLPASQLTYGNLAQYAEQFSRCYISYNKQVSVAPEPSSDTSPLSPAMTDIHSLAPMYYLIPVNKFGENLPNVGPLENTGNKLVSLPSNYLAMDWRNNPKDKDHVEVTINEELLQRSTTKKKSTSFNAKDIHLEDCLQLFTEPEQLPKDNAWYCPQCKEHREATKQMSIWRIPHILIITLKRFSFYNYIWRDKIDKLVKFPLRGLNLGPYMLDKAANQITPPPVYDLYATVNHYGNVYLGHYTAIVKPPVEDTTEWLHYDDESVSKLSGENKVLSNEAYILFYRRRVD